eukprot:3619517-Prorocentrum_lima.AAC.1
MAVGGRAGWPRPAVSVGKLTICPRLCASRAGSLDAGQGRLPWCACGVAEWCLRSQPWRAPGCRPAVVGGPSI